MDQPVGCFFAYSTDPPAVAESVENAISQFNRDYKTLVTIRGWKELHVTGRLIIDEICQAIDSCSVFICDLTTLNHNVLFELGYALAGNKKVWIALNTCYPQSARNYKKLSLLSTIGYAPYQNSFDLTKSFISDEPFMRLDATHFKSMMSSLLYSQSRPLTLLYLKSELRTEASVRLTNRLTDQIPLTIDDPEEVTSQPLMWYMQNIYHACGVVAHFIDQENEYTSTLLQNAKYALVSGIAFGLGMPLLMLAHAPFQSPVDYKHLLRVHRTAKECLKAVDPWLIAVNESYQDQLKRRQEGIDRVRAAVGLQRIHLGEHMAENEQQELSTYFVTTNAFKEALSTSQYRIYVGRKGTGKTANLYQIERELTKDARNHVCVIKPVDYEFEGVLNFLKSALLQADPGYLIESLWKFLIYTELALSIYKQLRAEPPYVQREEADMKLLEYLDSKEILRSEFTVRMEYAIQGLCQIDATQSIGEQRKKVSEILHRELLGDLRKLLGSALHTKNKAFVLVDNLDKAWKKREDLDTLARFIFGLLSAGQAIAEDLQKDRLKWPGINIALIVFLRSDIFSYVRSVARERDKVAFTRLDWNDARLLECVIEERFAAALGETLGETITPEEIWQRFFARTVKGVPARDYIVSHIIPRPRDIIHFCKNALSHAVNHRNIKIEEEDILHAEENYSEYAVSTLVAEIEAQVSEAQDLLYEFAGMEETINRDQLRDILMRVGIDEERLDHVIDLLYESAFLGLEIRPNNFEFLYETSRKEVFQTLARKTSEQTGQERYRINKPFYSFLEIQNS